VLICQKTLERKKKEVANKRNEKEKRKKNVWAFI
jgi:hypothetical protein